jgi:hypothetical protein
MRTNADMTIYHRAVAAGVESWTRTTVVAVMWEDRRAANARRESNIKADDIAVYIPMARGTITIKPGDVIVRGLVTDAVSTSFTITALKAKYPNSGTVRSVDRMDQGSAALNHWQVGAS